MNELRGCTKDHGSLIVHLSVFFSVLPSPQSLLFTTCSFHTMFCAIYSCSDTELLSHMSLSKYFMNMFSQKFSGLAS